MFFVGMIFFLYIGCIIDVPKGAASFAVISSLLWQISRKNGRGLKRPSPQRWVNGIPWFAIGVTSDKAAIGLILKLEGGLDY